MKSYWKNILKLNSNEQKGITALLLILGVFILGGILVPKIFKAPITEVNITIDTLKREKVSREKTETTPSNKSEKKKRTFSFQKFNPNKVTQQELESFGLTTKEAQNWVNYLKSGGVFKTENDLLKLYAINQDKLDAMKNYLAFPKLEKPYDSGKLQKVVEKRTPVQVEINTADTSSLKKLRGVGSYFAQKIVKYREQLGGFYKKEQLLEIWNFNQEVLSYPENVIISDTNQLKKLPLNTVSKENLAKHPYLTWKQANSIVNLRNQHGKYRKIEDVKNSILITDSLYQKIYPYLSLE